MAKRIKGELKPGDYVVEYNMDGRVWAYVKILKKISKRTYMVIYKVMGRSKKQTMDYFSIYPPGHSGGDQRKASVLEGLVNLGE